ncbi:MAG: hypothetical protein KKA60_01775 [Proteobacteria bacterium]|nr:hypothetical protein [Pseudomonadota bacterium]
MKKKSKKAFFAAVLLALSLVLSLVLAEVILRVARPDFKVLVENVFQADQSRIFTTPRNAKQKVRHPDLGKEHTVYYNALGFKQARDFSPQKPPGVIRIGIFGDSFSENVFMPSQYSFSEPLDFLLNQTGGRYEVLNFGTSGYGTDQEFIQYMEEGRRLDLDAALYMAYHNDLGEVLANRLFLLTEEGEVVRNQPRRPSRAIRFLKKFYLTYFCVDAWNRVRARTDPSRKPAVSMEAATRQDVERDLRRVASNLDEILSRSAKGSFGTRDQKSMLVFAAVMNTWKDEAARDGVRLFTVFVPDDHSYQKLMKWVISRIKVESHDLLLDFQAESPGMEGLFFVNDRHWNEEGNKIAAVYLFKFLADRLGISYDGDEFIRQNLAVYYSSLSGPHIPLSPAWLDSTRATPVEGAALRNQYLALEEEGERDEGRFVVRESISNQGLGHRDIYTARIREGLVCLESGMLGYARTWFEDAIREDPDSAVAHYALGVVLVKTGEADQGASHLREAVRLDPGLGEARKELERIGGPGGPYP